MSRRVLKNLFPCIILLCLCGLAKPSSGTDAKQEINFQKRKVRFLESIEYLTTHPDSLDLKIWIRPYKEFNLTALANYRDEISADFQSQKDKLNASQKIKWLYELGIVEVNLNHPEEAFAFYRQALDLSNKQTDAKIYIKIGIEMAFLYRQTKDCPRSNELLQEMLDLAIKTNNTKEQVHIKYWMAENYCNLGDYQEALTLCKELYHHAVDNNDFANAAYNLIQLGQIASLVEKDTSYFAYFHSAIEMAEKSGYFYLTGDAFSKTASAYREAGFYQNALILFEEAARFEKDLTERDLLDYLNGRSALYLATDSTEKAGFFAKKALRTAQNIAGELWQTDALSNLANYYTKTGKVDSALYYHHLAAKAQQQQNQLKHLEATYKALSDLYLEQNNYPLALVYLDSSYQSNTAFTEQSNANMLQKLRTETDYYIQQNKITSLVSKNQLANERSKRLIQLSVAITLLFMVSSLFFAKNRKQLKDLRESHLNLIKKNIELDRANQNLLNPKKLKKKKHKNKEINEDLWFELNQILITNAAYTDPNLSLKSLAEDLNTNTTYLSSLINTKYNCNFKTLVNQLRITKAKEWLLSPEFKNYSMEGIAENAGFRSRSSFYSSFKSLTGLTPSQYITNYHLYQLQEKQDSAS